jgi:acetylornithine deacetylase/succinyl-diaminopimelate desuccinylase-like protein
MNPRAATFVFRVAPVKSALLCCILATMSSLSARVPSRADPASGNPRAQDWASDSRVQRGLELLKNSAEATTQDQIHITEIPAPPFHEEARAASVKKLLADAGLSVESDAAGNVIGKLAGTNANDIVLVAAHLDTVFPAGTDVHVRRDGSRLLAPGISDNGSGLASLVAVARAMHEAKIETKSSIWFVADVGEEGEGNLRGMRALMDAYGSRLKSVIALDGSAIDYVSTEAIASRRVEIVISGAGGHSWSDFGAPNPINALARAIAKFVETHVPDSPRTTFNIGDIEGGTSVNAIPARASMKVDLRSEQESELPVLERELRADVQAGVDQEMAAARARGMTAGRAPLAITVNVLGVRPGGQLPQDSPLLAAVYDADRVLGNRSRTERSSTDANLPLSAGIPAISIGCGGQSAGAHTTGEWYDPTGRELGLQRTFLIVLGAAGLAP